MKTEILAPAGDETTAKIALLAGADAIYLGLKNFSARSSAGNFDWEAFKRTTEFAHLLGAKVYVCLNTLVKDDETDAFFASALAAHQNGADAILMQDLFLGKILKEHCPALTLHLSTQAGCCNEYGAKLAKEFGFSRVVLARETPIEDVKKITKIIETEVFVQGALCSAFSGQCYFSSFAGNNSGNRGRCKQPCRKKYSIDREGFEELLYALSPADLCVGERVRELVDAGVCSLKIEGRMRRSEYVASAVEYYARLLDGKNADRAFSDLKRAYNRGDYTEGLCFHAENILSRKVQGHIGERVGTLDKNLFCRSDYPAKKGDGFKILRNGYEVGGGVFAKSGKDGFYLASSDKLKAGDEVRLTTDSSLSERLAKRRRKISLSLRFIAGERAQVACGEFSYCGTELESAKNAPLTQEELKSCFCKTDGLPFEVSFERIELGNVFLPKSALNQLRREFFDALVKFLVEEPSEARFEEPIVEIKLAKTKQTAVIASKESASDILIYKPQDYTVIRVEELPKALKRYLYLPPFFTGADLEKVKEKLSLFDGIYCDGYYGLALARELKMPLFAGTGWNLTNRFSVSEAKKYAEYIALSKELSCIEQSRLAVEGAFVLSGGAIKIMDLCYCPFGGKCISCEKRELYTLTDESGRRFPLRCVRFAARPCRFELYNCNPLTENPVSSGKLTDETVSLFTPATKGHSERSML